MPNHFAIYPCNSRIWPRAPKYAIQIFA